MAILENMIDIKLQLLLFNKQWQEAKKYSLQRCLSHPNDVDHWFILGKINMEMRDFNNVASCFTRILKLDPNSCGAYFNLGRLQQELGSYERAINFYLMAISLNPNLAEAHTYLAYVYFIAGKLDESEKYFRRTLTLNPDFSNPHYYIHFFQNRGIAYTTAALNRHRATSYTSLGNVLKRQSKYEAALDSYNQALKFVPELPAAMWGRATLLLLLGNLRKGWKGYEWGQQVNQRNITDVPYPKWDGSQLAGKTLLICAEQGIGESYN